MDCSTISYNNLQSNGFTMTIDRLPQTMFRVTVCDIPSINIPAPEAGSPGSTQYFPGSATEFDTLSIEFLVDENLENYQEIFNWITQQRYMSKYNPRTDKEEKLVSDGAVIMLSNNSVPNKVFSFKNLFPIAIGPLHFDTTVSEPTSVTCTVEFRFSYFEINNV